MINWNAILLAYTRDEKKRILREYKTDIGEIWMKTEYRIRREQHGGKIKEWKEEIKEMAEKNVERKDNRED